MTFTFSVRLREHLHLGEARADFLSLILALRLSKVLELEEAPSPRARLGFLLAATSQDWGAGPHGANPLPAPRGLCCLLHPRHPLSSGLLYPHTPLMLSSNPCGLVHFNPSSEPCWVTPTYSDPSFPSYPFHT